MRLSEAELAEGRRLLEESRKQQAIDRMGIAATVWNRWVAGHADALLARREEIVREAVREFARKMASKFGANAQSWSVLANVDSLPAGRELALARCQEWMNAADEVTEAARGATLDEKP
ncbi:MAG: hypothetical protein KGL35_24415 [Bradyrhizobium sp.]|nr:hypothetical protein [Bradyrhizobium sp.]